MRHLFTVVVFVPANFIDFMYISARDSPFEKIYIHTVLEEVSTYLHSTRVHNEVRNYPNRFPRSGNFGFYSRRHTDKYQDNLLLSRIVSGAGYIYSPPPPHFHLLGYSPQWFTRDRSGCTFRQIWRGRCFNLPEVPDPDPNPANIGSVDPNKCG